MWKGLTSAVDLPDFIGQWYAGEVPDDAMMPPELAVQMIITVLASKLRAVAPHGNWICITRYDGVHRTSRRGAGAAQRTAGRVFRWITVV